MVTTPYLAPLRLSSGSIVAIKRAPVEPRGCPSAIAPPLTLTLAGSTLRCSAQNTAWL